MHDLTHIQNLETQLTAADSRMQSPEAGENRREERQESQVTARWENEPGSPLHGRVSSGNSNVLYICLSKLVRKVLNVFTKKTGKCLRRQL